MASNHIVIIGGGLAGLSAGAYARASGYRTTLIEHNESLGGVCTAWRRGEYLLDGCMHWLTEGPFDRIYRELGILQQLQLKPIVHFAQVKNVHDRIEVDFTIDLDSLTRQLIAIAPEDEREIRRIIDAADHVADLAVQFVRPRELQSARDALTTMWSMRQELPSLVHFRKSVAEFGRTNLKNPKLTRVFARLISEEGPMLSLVMLIGFLHRGWLSRPFGGAEAFRDAAIESYRRLGGEARLGSTVEEVLVRDGRATGVRLQDGTMIDGDAVISTSSAPETMYQLLGGRFGADEFEKRARTWGLYTPIVLASYGVKAPLIGLPQMLMLDGIEPVEVGETLNDHLYVRIYNDDPAFAPAGHAVIQVLAETDYSWWAKLGDRYAKEKDAVGRMLLAALDEYVPGVRDAARMTDVSTPLTFWNMARSWRGAYEGWKLDAESMPIHIPRTVKGLDGFYMAGQWVEGAGGIPIACASGRNVVELLCADTRREFKVPIEVPLTEAEAAARAGFRGEEARPTLH